MNSLRQHIQIAKVDVHKSPIEKLKSNIDARAHQVTDTLATRNQVPPEALITL